MAVSFRLNQDLMQSMYPFSRLSDAANVLIMPNLAGKHWIKQRNTPMA